MHISLANYTTPKQAKKNLHIWSKSSVAYILFESLLNYDTSRNENTKIHMFT